MNIQNLNMWKLVLNKNVLVKKKRWIQSIVCQILFPVALCLIAGYYVHKTNENASKPILYNLTTWIEEQNGSFKAPELPDCLKNESALNQSEWSYDSLYWVNITEIPNKNNNSALVYTIPVAAAIIFVIILSIEAPLPATESHTGINILMSMNGVKDYMNLCCWLCTAALHSFFYLIPMLIIFTYFPLLDESTFLPYSNGFLIFLSLFLYILHLIAFGYHGMAYFSKPADGLFVTILVTSLNAIIAFFVEQGQTNRRQLYLGIFFPLFELENIFSEIIVYEHALKQGIRWSNLFVNSDDRVPVEGSVGMLMILSILGTIFHILMTIYVNAVRPGKYGIGKSLLYFLQRDNREAIVEDWINSQSVLPSNREYEVVPPDSLEPGIQIRGLKKLFLSNFCRKTSVYALREISMDFYKGQITALLGHNGAGKTTMMSILTGLTDSTVGAVLINGRNIRHDPAAISDSIGFCPQENMIFPDLNVRQHLKFFGRLKAKNKTNLELEIEVNSLLAKVNLTDKKHAIPNELSGGQRRRLCLAMAVIGDGNVLILDEPTSGMDAESKREVWDIVLKLRGEKTIIISTHDMEEAEILGDRVAILDMGKLKSYGTSMFLKKLHGDGQVEVKMSVEPWCDLTKIFQEIGTSAQVSLHDEGRIILGIPMSKCLPEILDKLEKSKKQLGITGMSVSIITLEQVLLKVTSGNTADTGIREDIIPSSPKISGKEYYKQTLLALLLKILTYTWKKFATCMMSLLLPCLAALFLLILTINSASDEESLKSFALKISHLLDETKNNHTSYQTPDELIEKMQSNCPNSTENLNSTVQFFIPFNKSDPRAATFRSDSRIYHSSAPLQNSSRMLAEMQNNNSSFIGPMDISSEQYNHIVAIAAGISTILALAVALYVMQPLQEMRSGLRQLQLMTGTSTIAYWASIYVFDVVKYLISISLLLATLEVVDNLLGTDLYHEDERGHMFALLALFGISILPFIYFCCFMRKSVNSTITMLSLAPIVLVPVDLFISHIFFISQLKVLLWFLFPHVSFTYGLFFFIMTMVVNAERRQSATNEPPSFHHKKSLPFFTSFEEIFGNDTTFNRYGPSPKLSVIFLVISPIFYSIIIFLLEQQYIAKLLMKIRGKREIRSHARLDEMVIKENVIIADEVAKRQILRQTSATDENVFLVHGLKKNYGRFPAVKGISFRVKVGECFGLLGVNGAGKSTTFRMLTGDEIPHGGTMYLNNHNIVSDRVQYLSQMGYCPQQDAIIDTFNAWDHLKLFARLRGIPSNEVDVVVKKWVKKLNLTECAAHPSGTYSGGNKRRLNIAMALIGNSPLVLMDEPTTGVDPAARRSLWNTLKSCQEAGQSIILTSHSMEECEVLCNRLVIMVRGQIVCVGPSQELKQRFGAGYNIQIKLTPTRVSDAIANIKQRIESELTCKLVDESTGFLGYHVTDHKISWTTMYAVMENLKTDFSCVEDFTILSSTLEQLFLQFSRRNSNDCDNVYSLAHDILPA